MPLQLVRQRLRLRADERSRLPLLDSYTNATPQGWARAATQFEVALASGGALVDVGNLSSVTLEASPYNNRKAARVFSKTVASGALDNTLTEAAWIDGTQQHVTFSFSSAEMNLPLGGAPQVDFWLVVSALTAAGDSLVCGAGKFTMSEDGAFADAPPAPGNPAVLLTVDQADARYVQPAGALNLAAGITGATGGGPARLDGLPTRSLPTYYALLMSETGQGLTEWVLEPDGDPGAGTRNVSPADHDPASNARTWRQRL